VIPAAGGQTWPASCCYAGMVSVPSVDSLPSALSETLERCPGGRVVRLMLAEGVVSPRAVEKALRVQEKLGGERLLSAILVELGVISEDDHRRVIRRHGRKFRIGELLTELGFITLEQLRQTEGEMARHPGMPMGQLLVKLRHVTQQQVAQALSEQLGMPLIHLDEDMVDRDLAARFPVKFMRTHQLLPFDMDESRVRVVTCSPLNNPAIDEVGARLGRKVDVALVSRDTLLAVLDRLGSKDGAAEGGREPVASVVDDILLAAIRDRASDIHIEPLADRVRIRFRMDGVLIHKMDLPVSLAQRVTARLKVLAGMDIADTRCHQDGRTTQTIGDVETDLRISTYVTVHGENLVMRILRHDGGLRSLEQIQMSPGLLDRFKHEALDAPTGVILITGPTGSGKTTTLYAAIDYLNRPTTKIITLEDPVEYVVDGIMQCSVNAKAGRTFESSLKAIVRQDPDVIVLGEVRDRMSAEVAVQAALTGHKVLTTFHTEDSIGGLLRLMDMGIETFLISSTVVSILAQRLIRTICPDCRQTYMPNRRIARMIGVDDETLRHHVFYRGVGCATCHGTGYHGRTALHELLILNEDVREAILERKTSHEVRQISCESTQLLSLMENGIYKVLKGLTTVDEVYRVAPRSLRHRSVNEIRRLMGEEA